MKYKLKNFEEYLKSNDEQAIELGYQMAYNSFPFKTLSLDELNYLLIELGTKYREHSSSVKHNLIKRIDKLIMKKCKNNINRNQYSYYRALTLIKKDYIEVKNLCRRYEIGKQWKG